MRHRLVVWRHGRTAWNLANRFQGHTDIELDDEGRRQAERVAPALAALRPDAIASSDLRRAASTAAALSRLTGRTVTTDASLREAYADKWEGLTRDEILASDGDRYHRWRTDASVRPGGGGETAAEVGARVAGAVQRHLDGQGAGDRLVVVTHGGSARALIGTLLGWPVAAWRRMAVMDNCGWAELDADDSAVWRLVAYNRSGR